MSRTPNVDPSEGPGGQVDPSEGPESLVDPSEGPESLVDPSEGPGTGGDVDPSEDPTGTGRRAQEGGHGAGHGGGRPPEAGRGINPVQHSE